MQNKVLNIISGVLAVITEIWALRLFGINDWSDIIAGVGIMFCVPIVVLPFAIFRFWLEYIFGEDNKNCYKKDAKRDHSTSEQKKETAFNNDAQKGNRGSYTKKDSPDTGRVFLYFVSTLAAKIASADGHVDSSETTAIELAFSRLGLSEQQHKFCIEIFQHSITSSESISSITLQLKASSVSDELTSILYEILWNVACADGILKQSEKTALKTISEILGLYSYERYYHQRVKQKEQKQTGQHTNSSGRMSLDDAYEILGCSDSDTDTDIKSAYREKAKRNHPDILKSQGLPEEMIDLATKRMAEINAAWEIIKKSRNF
jgi:DnaJ like chaperone protein